MKKKRIWGENVLEIICGEAGSGKTYALAEKTKALVKSDKRVIVIVPDQFNFEYGRSLYRHIGAETFNQCDVTMFSRVARAVLRDLGVTAGTAADDAVKVTTMYRALQSLVKEKGLDFYAKQAEKACFTNDALEIVKTFRANGITAACLSDRASKAPEAIRAKFSDISLIYTRYTKLLDEIGSKDGDSSIGEAAAKASGAGYFKGMDIIIDEFKSFTPDESALLRVIIAEAESVTAALSFKDFEYIKGTVFETPAKTALTLCGYAKECGCGVKLTEQKGSKRYKYPELEHLSRNIMRTKRSEFNGKCSQIKIYKSDNPYSEADFVCAEIRRLITEEEMRCGEIAVLAREKEKYTSILQSAAERYDLPLYISENAAVSHKSLVIFVLSAVSLAAKANPTTEDWLRYIKTDFAVTNREECGIMEDYCYKWSVEGEMWFSEFRINEDSDRIAEKVRYEITEPIVKLRERCGKRAELTVGEICVNLYDFFDEIGLQKRIERYSAEYEAEKFVTDAASVTVLREMRQIWNMLTGLFMSVYRSAGEEKMSLMSFGSMLSLACSKLTIAAPPQTLDAVGFYASNSARLASPKAVFILGANEGAFPYSAKPSALITDKEIAALKECGIELSGSASERAADERYVVYSSVSAASERLYLCYSNSASDGGALYPSAVLRQTEGLFGNDITLTAEKAGTALFCSTPAAAYYHYVGNYQRGSSENASIRTALERSNPETAAKFAYLDELTIKRRHHLSHTGSAIFGEQLYMSASRFEDYRKCPFIYFCKKGLRIYPVKKLDIDSISRGSIIHFCLCEFMKAVPAEQFRIITDEEMREKIDLLLNEYFHSSEIGGSFGKTSTFNAAFGRLSGTLADILTRLRDEFRISKFVPTAFEYKLGQGGDEPAVQIGSNGAKMYFIGSVDRIDTYSESGQTYVRVIDYKSGQKTFSLDDIYYGINMQMLLYLFEITAAGRKGKFHGDIATGALYMPAKDLICGLERTDDDISSMEKDTYKMNGILLYDSAALNAMESGLSGIYIPIKKNKDGTIRAGSSVYSQSNLDKLREYTEKLAAETAKDIHSGKIEANPLVKGMETPCKCCDYKSVCGNYPNIVSRTYAPDAKKRMEEIINPNSASITE